MKPEETKDSGEKGVEKVEEKVEETEEETTEKVKAIEEKGEKIEEVEGAKPPTRKEIAEEIVEERFYTIPLGKARIVPPNKRAPKAIRIIRNFIRRHMKLEARTEGEEEEETESRRVIISNEVNKKIWSRSIENPPRKIRVRAVKDKDGNVTVYLAEGD